MRSHLLMPGIAAIVMALPSPTLSSASAAAPTQACVAIVLPSVRGVEGSATEVGTALRDLFASYLNGPSVRAVPLETRLASQAIEEAREKGCNHILISTLTRKRSDGNSALAQALGTAVGTAAYQIPGYGASAAVARGVAVGGAQAASTIASNTRAKDEMRLEYRFSSLDAAARAVPITDKAKARADREDLLTPMVERAAETIVAAVTRK